MSAPAVLKLGGSLANSAHLARWATAVAEHGGGRVVVVPGGGPFADQVRQLQVRWRYSDRAAHRMAILAMEQYGQLLASLARGLVPCESMAAMRRALAAGHVPVWQPLRMAGRASDLRSSWDVTSDSLAAWLALRLRARVLVLVKSCAIPAGADLESLAVRGIVDRALPGVVAGRRLRVALVNQRSWRTLAGMLDELRG